MRPAGDDEYQSGGGDLVQQHRESGYGEPAQAQVDASDEPLGGVEPAHVPDQAGRGETPDGTQPDDVVRRGHAKQKHGSVGAGDQYEDHGVVESLHPPTCRLLPADPVVEGAGGEHAGDAGRVGAGSDLGNGAVRGGQ